MNSKHRPEELASYCPSEMLSAMLRYSHTSLNCCSHPRSPLLAFSEPVLACVLLPADVFPALTLPAAATGWSPRAPAHLPCVWPQLAKGCWLWFPSMSLDSSRVTQDSSEGEQPAVPSPAGTLAACGHGWHGTSSVHVCLPRWQCLRDMPCRGHGGDLPSRRKRVSAPSVWALVPHHQPQPAHPEFAVLANEASFQASAYLCKHLPDAGSGSQREWKIAVVWPTKKNVQNCQSDSLVIKKQADISSPYLADLLRQTPN